MADSAAAHPLRIGELAAEFGMHAKTIRYYEQIGLLPAPQRSPAGYRLYDDTVRDGLRFIVKAKALGFTLAEIREVLARRRAGQQPCAYVAAVLDREIVAIHQRVRSLLALRRDLVALRGGADERMHVAAAVCAIIEQHEPAHRAERDRSGPASGVPRPPSP